MNTISQVGKVALMSYFVCGLSYSIQECYSFWWRSEVICCQQWSVCENHMISCKHDISRREIWIDVIHSIWCEDVPYEIKEGFCVLVEVKGHFSKRRPSAKNSTFSFNRAR